MTKAYPNTRNVPGLGLLAVLEVKMSPDESARFHGLPVESRRRQLVEAGLTEGLEEYYWTNDSDGNVYYYEVV